MKRVFLIIGLVVLIGTMFIGVKAERARADEGVVYEVEGAEGTAVIVDGKQTGINYVFTDGMSITAEDVGISDGFCLEYIIDQDMQFNIQMQSEDIELNLNFTIKDDRIEFQGSVFGETVKDGSAFDGKFQMRIGREMQIDFSTGTSVLKWCLRVNKCLIRTDKEFDEYSQFAYAFNATGAGEAEITRIGDIILYDIERIENGIKISEEGIGYSTIEVTWTLPDAEFGQGGPILERKKGDEIEKTVSFNTPYVASFRDEKLKQGTEYTYRIYMVDSLDLNKTLCPKILVDFGEYSAITDSGNPTLYIVLIATVVVTVIGLMLLYIFWYKIKGCFRRKDRI